MIKGTRAGMLKEKIIKAGYKEETADKIVFFIFKAIN